MKTKKFTTLLLLLASSTSAIADHSDKLTGSWNGLRTELAESGISPFAYYDSIAATNVSGGITSDEAYTGQLYAGVDLTLNNEFTARVSMVDRHGDSISESVGGIYDPMTIYGGQVTYLYEAWLEKSWSEEWAVKFGRVSADADFANSPLYRYSLSTSVNGPSRAMLLENSITSFPYAVWGARLKHNVSDDNQFQFGVYQIGEDMWKYQDHGTNFDISSDDGWTAMGQYDWTPTLAHGDAHFYVGIAQSFYDFDKFDGSGTTDKFTRLYGYSEIKATDNTSVFAAVTYAYDDDIAKTPFQANLGINIEGVFNARPNDHSFAHLTYGQLSDEYGESIKQSLDYEMVFEIGHRFQIAPAYFIQPAVQYVNKPGGTGDIDDSVILGMWFGVAM